MGSYKDEFVAKHGTAAYAKKLKENAEWRKANPEAMAEYAEKRSKKASGEKGKVIIVSDVHLGSQTTDVDLIKNLAKEYWSDVPIILNGDIIEAALDRGMQFGGKLDPQPSIDLVVEIFKPLNVIGYRLGNHELRISKATGVNIYKQIFGTEQSTTVNVNGREIYFSHGRSACENMFLEFQKIVKWCSADLICLGHSHDLARISFKRGNKIQTLVRTGSFIGREEYAVKVEYFTGTNFVMLKGLTDEKEVFEM
jgi:UDP-2,3-diacylglucosamine pyrophosphatase LpxH